MPPSDLTLVQTLVLAVVEGLTEFLPVSSTGHMIIVQKLLGIESTPFVKAFTIIIQFGAILSVVCLYWRRFFRLNDELAPADVGAVGRFLHRWDFYWKLLLAFLPAVVLGLVAKATGLVDRFLESVHVVAAMLLAGGVFMLFCDKLFGNGREDTPLTPRRAVCIGLFQCISMIPGVSRSMATIVGGMAQRLTRRNAAEFSFFLAVPTMAAATALDLLEVFFGDTAAASWATSGNVAMLLVGCLVAFAVALLAMKWFVAFLARYGFRAFGVYRILVGALLLALLLAGVDLAVVD